MSLQMVDINERNVQGTGESLGKANTHQERAHQTRSTGKSDSTQVLLGDASTLDSLIDHRYHVLLMRTRSQLRNHTAVCTMHLLRCRDIAQQHSISEYRSRSVITTALYTQNINIFLFFHDFYTYYHWASRPTGFTLLYIST
ncbi:unknown [Prevotella sp. CAG:732]|nr:unknown [Prevotella sp. CAG:732]